MLWIEQSRIVKQFADDEALQRFCVNCPEDEFVRLLNAANRDAKEAREHEMLNVGIAPESSIDKYYNAASSMNDVIDKCDLKKLKQFQRFRLVFWIKHHFLALFIGLVSGLLVAYITGSWMFDQSS